MAKQTINIGSGELAGDGESLRSALNKCNSNFDELYTADLSSYTVTESDVTAHQGALSITESQISDFGTYLRTVIAPTTSAGQAGDVPGTIAIDSNYIYYCYRDFPRQEDYIATLANRPSSSDNIRLTVNFVDFPTDIYDGFDLFRGDGTTLIGRIESVSPDESDNILAQLRVGGFQSGPVEGETVIIKYNTNAKIWRRSAFNSF